MIQAGCWALAAALALVVMLVAYDAWLMAGAMLASIACALFWAASTRVRQRTRAEGWPV